MSNPNLTKPQEAFGLHLTLDGYGCDRAVLADLLGIYKFLDEAPAAIGMTKIMAPHVQEYRPPPGRDPRDWGLSGFVMIAESHISIHTFPERLFLSLDIFSCKRFEVDQATMRVIDFFKCRKIELKLIYRGLEYPRNEAAVAEHLRRERRGFCGLGR
jgi:S-adenosylmethionine decarboxylase